MSELISIVLPVYNGERYLRESVDSVLRQTYTNWELLLLDDCSSDDTPQICKVFAKEDPRIIYHRNVNNLKLPGNLNKGFSLAKGNLLTWTSDDNRFRENALEKMEAALRENQADLVYASYQVMDEEDIPGIIIHADHRTLDHIPGSNVVGACFLYTREAYEKVGEYDTDLMLVEDFDFWQRMIPCCKTAVIDEVLYDYRWHLGSLTSTKKQDRFGKVLEAMLEKNKHLFLPMNLEQKWYFYRCLRSAYAAQGEKLKGRMNSSFFTLVGKVRSKVERLRKSER